MNTETIAQIGGHWWLWVLLASAIAYATKLLGYGVPARWLHHPRMARVAGSLTIALLAALTAMNTFSSGHQLVLDARLAALAVAAIALALRAPFLLVVVLGAGASAAVRWWM
ncbi:putative membrane protein [Comamonas odontotermitis]|uniref:Membrane protein n=1 Tax=Comamonas odontotermitis TaxID=379895 RepID=A0ABR6RCN6_9BURK|nr:AzlD domain-containing protein [Comamonas odontotermitis]MBB6576911.1 putative membrane protein [Comamonas odontotermitis]